MSNKKYLGPDLESRIIQFLQPHVTLIEHWTAELLASFEAPEYPEFLSRKNPKKEFLTIVTGKYDFLIKLSKSLSTSELKNLIILSWFFPEETRKIIFTGAMEVSKTRRFVEQVDLTIYMKSKIHCLLLLQQQKKTYTAFFGELGQVMKLIRTEVEAIHEDKDQSIVFSRPFWKRQNMEVPVKRYNGYSRHHKDAGSLPPSSSRITKEIARDRLIQEEYRLAREKFEFDIWSTTEFLIGFIE